MDEALEPVRDEAIVTSVDAALPEVYGYLLHRCGSRELAEDLTSEVVLSTIDRLRNGTPVEITAAYLVTVARNKLVDHWRREARQKRNLVALSGGATDEVNETSFEPGASAACMALLNPLQRTALTLRYVDDLPVADVARTIGRSLTATETLLVRAKRAFRDHYARMATPAP